MEATPGIEPGIKALQASALPLGHVAMCGIRGYRIKEEGWSFGSVTRNLRTSLRSVRWSGRPDSNRRPQPWQGCALPTEPRPRAEVSLSGTIRRRKGQFRESGQASLNRGLPIWGSFATLSFAALHTKPHQWAISSGGEHFLDTEGVRGSNPLSPTIGNKTRRLRKRREAGFLFSGRRPDSGLWQRACHWA